MTRPSTFSLGVLALLIGWAAAGPQNLPHPRVAPSTACQDHNALHSRLDVVEKRVQDTVDMLETELAVLLDAIEAPEWSPLLDTSGKPEVDILDPPGDRTGS